MTIARWIARHAAFQPDKPAIHCGGKTWTYRGLNADIAALSRALLDDLGLKFGDRIAYYGLNSGEMIVALFAAARAGMVLVPINWRLAAPEIRYILEDCGVAAMLVDDTYQASVAEIDPPLTIDRIIGVGTDGASYRRFDDLLDANRTDTQTDVEEVDPRSPLLIVYTSGTTGRPKGAVLSQDVLLYNALNSVHLHDMQADDHVLSYLPMFHVGGLNIQTTPALYCGATVTLMPRFEPGEALAAIRTLRPSLTVMVPAIMQALLNHPQWPDTDIGCLRTICTGSTDVPVPLIEAMLARGVPVQQVYGSTETGPVAIYQRVHQARSHVGSIGQAGLHCDVRIVDGNGRDLPDGESGEILIRGRNILSGYWGNEEETHRVLRDGWFHTGDVAHRDADGFYWFADRIKHVIISGGENIYPAELDRILNGIEDVTEAIVIGRDDAKWGEVPIAIVVRRSEALSEADIMAVFAEQVARFKHPKEIVFVDQLPRNVMGKIVVADVKVMLRSRFGMAI